MSVFEAERDRLFGIAYRMLGSVTEAEDVVQDAWLAWEQVSKDAVREPAAYLTTVVTRRCIDLLRSRRLRDETYPGPWLPEPLVPTVPDASEDALMTESVRMAFLVVLESLSPLQRAAFLLRDVFAFSYPEIAKILARTEPACRQLVARARGELRERRPRFAANAAEANRIADRFLNACATGDIEELVLSLHADVTLVTDGGGRVAAARRAITGPDRVSRFILGILKKYPTAGVERTEINKAPGVLMSEGQEILAALSIDIEEESVRRIHVVRNPDKLQHLAHRSTA